MTIVDWLGIVGVFLVLLAYVLQVTGKIDRKDLTFIILNLIGACIACIASVLLNYIPFVILEGVWAMVSLVSLFQYKSPK